MPLEFAGENPSNLHDISPAFIILISNYQLRQLYSIFTGYCQLRFQDVSEGSRSPNSAGAFPYLLMPAIAFESPLNTK